MKTKTDSRTKYHVGVCALITIIVMIGWVLGYRWHSDTILAAYALSVIVCFIASIAWELIRGAIGVAKPDIWDVAWGVLGSVITGGIIYLIYSILS